MVLVLLFVGFFFPPDRRENVGVLLQATFQKTLISHF